MGELVQDLQLAAEALIETHISWVFLCRDEVFKLKKPVNFGFLDFSDLASRKRACVAEVALNGRLAPGVYLGVVPVTRGANGRHAFGGQGPIVDFAVHMKRLDETARADRRLEAGQLGVEQLDMLAARLARFHAEAARSPEIAEYGRSALIRRNVEENFTQAAAQLRALAPESVERQVEEQQLGFLARHQAWFERRIDTGRVCDGHGDLRLEHVYLVDGQEPLVIDCIEFNDRFRCADVCADVAFLSMDLAWHGRLDLKEQFLAAYARRSADYDLYALVDFYESYRAYVRAKVNAFSLASPDLSFQARVRLEQQTRRYLLLSLAAERPALVMPRLFAVGGIIASGKSTVADAVGRALAIPVVSSDETRKSVLGVQATTPLLDAPWQGAYSPSANAAVYKEVLRRARVVLESGRSVIVDASFRSREARAAVRSLAADTQAAFRFIECRAEHAVCRARLQQRARSPSVSDGRLEIFDEFVARYEPVTELGADEHVIIDTTAPLPESLRQLSALGMLTNG